MTRDDAEQEGTYKVVVNHEEQYSIWPRDRANPVGWRDAGRSGSKADCLAYIEAVWTDIAKGQGQAGERRARGAPESPRDGAARIADELGDRLELTERHRRVAEAFARALAGDTPRVYPGRVTLFRTRMQPFFGRHAPDKGWGRWAPGGVVITVTPANPFAMLREPHVRTLAAQLRASLNRA